MCQTYSSLHAGFYLHALRVLLEFLNEEIKSTNVGRRSIKLILQRNWHHEAFLLENRETIFEQEAITEFVNNAKIARFTTIFQELTTSRFQVKKKNKQQKGHNYVGEDKLPS